MKQILTVLDDYGNFIDLYITKNYKIGKMEAFWYIDNNILFLGEDRFTEWESISGDSEKQKKFLENVKRISNTELNN